MRLASPFSFLYVVIKRVSSVVVRMLSNSLKTGSVALFTHCKIFVSAQFIEPLPRAVVCSAAAPRTQREPADDDDDSDTESEQGHGAGL